MTRQTCSSFFTSDVTAMFADSDAYFSAGHSYVCQVTWACNMVYCKGGIAIGMLSDFPCFAWFKV